MYLPGEFAAALSALRDRTLSAARGRNQLSGVARMVMRSSAINCVFAASSRGCIPASVLPRTTALVRTATAKAVRRVGRLVVKLAFMVRSFR